MANRQRAEARRKAAAKASRGTSGSKMWLWVTLAVVAVAGVIATVVILSGGDDETDADGTEETTPDSQFPDSQPVTVTGDNLPEYGGPYASQEEDPAFGTSAPVLEGKNFQGQDISVDGTANGPTMVVFLAHWCPHCNAEVPRLLDWKNSGGVPQGLNVVGVATAVSSERDFYPPAEWFETKGWSWPVMVDEKNGDIGNAGKAAVAYGATGWPYFVIVGSDGQVLARASGELEVDQIQAIVDAAMAAA
jgi:cytochrome c biogenesis protein CcmG/thiol:disulfide interchange protein DsbE